MRSRLLLSFLALAAASTVLAQDGGVFDFGVTRHGGRLDAPARPQPRGAFCDGVNYANDNHFDPAFMGGPMVAWQWSPASSTSIGRIEIYTGEVAGASRVALWSDDGGAPGAPLAPLGWSDPFATEVPKAWYGADLVAPVPVVAGAPYWIVWDPAGNEQVSASDDPADALMNYYGSPPGTVEGGASWSGPFNFADRRWKARLSCVGACEDPALFVGLAKDASSCNDGILVSWEPADFPGSGAGLYHVYRSLLSFADALLQLPVARDLVATSWLDVDTRPGENWYYVVMAESTDFAACGDGPAVGGSTDTLDLGPVEDSADQSPPSGRVGNALRATGYSETSVDFEWTLAPLPDLGEAYAVFSASRDPAGAFLQILETPDQAVTDPDAVPVPDPVHVYFYFVRLIDGCGNLSDD